MNRSIIVLAVDPGLTGAAVGLSDSPRLLACRAAHGTGGYYSGVPSGRLPFRAAADVLHSLRDELARGGAAPSEVWFVVEEAGKWATGREGASRLAKVVADVTTWRNAAQLVADHVVVWSAQRTDRAAGLRRRTRGRAGRKAEVRRFNLQNVERGDLPPFREIPPGCSVPSDGLHDAVHMARGLLRVAKGGML